MRSITLVIASLCASTLAAFSMTGIAESCLEFGSNFPGVFNKDYTVPSNSSIAYFAKQVGGLANMSLIRLPFLWERLQPQLNGDFDAAYLGLIQSTVNYATIQGLNVLLDPHNYARYYGQVIGLEGSNVTAVDYAAFWAKLARLYANQPNIIFGLMNEPHDMPTEVWVADANAAAAAIRATGATNLLTVPGNAWTGAHSWTQNWYGTANSVAMLAFVDPLDNYVFEMHQYLDANFGGSSPTCVSATVGADNLQDATAWLLQNKRRAFLGEFAGGNNPTCQAAVTGMLALMQANSAAWYGWSWWAAGPWWGSSWASLEPPAAPGDGRLTWLAPFEA